jgi:hypothetical protein
MATHYLLAASALMMAAALPVTAHADEDVTQSAAASRDSAVSSVKLAAAGVKLVAGVAFTPMRRTLRDSDDAARAVGESGRVVNESANDKLDVSPETVQAQPAPKVPYDTQDKTNGDPTPQGGR